MGYVNATREANETDINDILYHLARLNERNRVHSFGEALSEAESVVSNAQLIVQRLKEKLDL